MDERIETVARHLSERIVALQDLLLDVRSGTRAFGDAYERLARWADRTERLIEADLGIAEATKFSRVGRGTMHVHKASVFSEICDEYAGFLQALYEDVLANAAEWLHRGRIQPEGRAIRAIMFSDIVGSTEHIGQVGDAVWQRELADHYRLSVEVIEQFGGRVVKRTGDGVLATFALPTSAIDASVELKRRTKTTGLPIRVGIHIGEVDVTADDVTGLAVHVAARLLDDNDGAIVMTEAVRELAVGSGLAFVDIGTRELKGVQGDWRLFELSETGAAIGPRLTRRERDERLKEILDLTLKLKDAAFGADADGLRWSNDMANAAFKMRTVLAQLPTGMLPPQVHEYSYGQAAQVIGVWQFVYSVVEQALLTEG